MDSFEMAWGSSARCFWVRHIYRQCSQVNCTSDNCKPVKFHKGTTQLLHLTSKMVVHNPNNWHWVDKNCLGWAREYFQEKLVGLAAQEGDCQLSVTSVKTVDGDCEVSQRKGKVISLFDLKIVLAYDGELAGDKFEGTVSVPEVAFDSDPEDYQFVVTIFQETSKLNERVKPLIRERLVPQLRSAFQQFGPDLLTTHSSDIQVGADQVSSTFTRANQEASVPVAGASQAKAPASAQSTAKSSTQVQKPVEKTTSGASASKPGTTSRVVNTSSMHLEPSFNVPAAELQRTFLDRMRLQQFSRSELRMLHSSSGSGAGGETLGEGDEYELFGGNVRTRVVSVGDSSIKLQWRLSDWTPEWFSELSIEFHESQEYHETKLKITWDKIPVGQEDRVRQNFEEYYVRAIKLTFGFGAVL